MNTKKADVIKTLISCYLILMWTGTGHAGALTPEQSRVLERNQTIILQQQEQKRQAIEKQQQNNEPGSIELDIEQLPRNESIDKGPCFDITEIKFSGNTLLSNSDLEKLRQPYVNQCLSLTDIDNLLRDINNLYFDKGYVTTRAYLSEQAIQDGRLKINIVKGIVDKITYNAESDSSKRKLITALPGILGEIFNIRDIEQGLDQINRLPSNNATVALLPGKEVGTSEVVVSNTVDKQYRIQAGMDNSGTASTGEVQRKLNLGIDDLFKINDIWSLSLASDNIDEEKTRSRSVAASLSIPFGYWTLYANSDYFQYNSPIQSLNTEFITSGESFTNSLNLNRVIHRNKHSKTSLDGKLTLKKTVNFIQGNRIDTASRSLTLMTLGLNHSRRIGNGLFTSNIRYVRGLNILGALDDPDTLGPGEASAQYEKYTADIEFRYPIFLNSQYRAEYSISFSGQYTDDDMFNSEQISLGGFYSVRGFRDEILSADTGGYFRNQLDIYLPRVEHTVLKYLFDGTILYLGYDVGAVRNDPTNSFEQGNMQGWAIGLRKTSGLFTWDLTHTQSLSSPDFINEAHSENYISLFFHF